MNQINLSFTLALIMTTINFKDLMKQAKMKSAKGVIYTDSILEEQKPNTNEMSPILSPEPIENQEYTIETYKYDIDEEFKRFDDYFAKWKVGSVDFVYYIPNFVNEIEENELLSKINGQPDDKWTQLKRRRLQNWGGIPSSDGMIPEKLPDWLKSLCERLKNDFFFPKEPNHVLINEYTGNEGISAHKDGPVYFPRVVILSLGGTARMNFKDKLRDPDHESSLLLKPRSLLIFTKDAYQKYYHEIPSQFVDTIDSSTVNAEDDLGTSWTRSTRVSLTLRIVPNVKLLNQKP